MSEHLARAGRRVYTYLVTHVPSHSIFGPYTWLGSAHGEEIPYVMGSPFMFDPDVQTDYRMSGRFGSQDEVEMSLQMMKYWSNFAKTGWACHNCSVACYILYRLEYALRHWMNKKKITIVIMISSLGSTSTSTLLSSVYCVNPCSIFKYIKVTQTYNDNYISYLVQFIIKCIIIRWTIFLWYYRDVSISCSVYVIFIYCIFCWSCNLIKSCRNQAMKWN